MIQVMGFKGQIKPKADWHAVDSPKKRMNKFGFLPWKAKKQTKKNSFVCFLGESTVCQSAFGFIWPLWRKLIVNGNMDWFVCCEKQKKPAKQIRSFVFWENYDVPICFRFYLTFNWQVEKAKNTSRHLCLKLVSLCLKFHIWSKWKMTCSTWLTLQQFPFVHFFPLPYFLSFSNVWI